MKKFEIKKSYEEVDIEGDVYRIDVSDNKIKSYIMEGYNLQKVINELNLSETETAEELEAQFEEIKDAEKKVTDLLLGEGAFEKIYPKTGESIHVLADVLYQVIDYLNEKQKEDLEKKKAKYTKKRR
jgi:hypothetical protein